MTTLEMARDEHRTGDQLSAAPHRRPRQAFAHARTATQAPNNYGAGPRVVAGGGGGSSNRRGQLGQTPNDRNSSVADQPMITAKEIAWTLIIAAWIVTGWYYGVDYVFVTEQLSAHEVMNFTGLGE